MARMTRTWWGEAFLDVLEQCMDPGRLWRGRAYSGPNRLLKFSIKGTRVSAVMRGNINPHFGVYKEPRYSVSVQLTSLSDSNWQKITKAITGNAACLSQLLMDEMPAAIDELCRESGTGLLPRSRTELQTQCSCPDWASPCKHVAGVYYKIASLLDRDPMLLFQLRGMTLHQLQSKLAKSPLGQALIDQCKDGPITPESHDHHYTQPRLRSASDVSCKSFWLGNAPLPKIDAAPEPPTPAVLIKRGGDHPPFWHLDKSFVAVMEDVCTRVVEKNKHSL